MGYTLVTVTKNNPCVADCYQAEVGYTEDCAL